MLPDGIASWTITAPADEFLAAEDLVERQAITAAGRTAVTGFPLGMDRKTKRINPTMGRWLHYRETNCRFPGCNRPAAKSDIDRTREWFAHSGPTNKFNPATR